MVENSTIPKLITIDVLVSVWQLLLTSNNKLTNDLVNLYEILIVVHLNLLLAFHFLDIDQLKVVHAYVVLHDYLVAVTIIMEVISKVIPVKAVGQIEIYA